MNALRQLVASVTVFSSILASGAAAARPPEGGYFGFGLGYGAASGDRGVAMKPGSPGIPFTGSAYDEAVRTDFGSGLAFDLRFGYLAGPIAPELSLAGHGTLDFEDGAGYATLGVRFHPLLLVDSLADLAFDASVFVAAGYGIGGYQPSVDDDGKGWQGFALTFGLGATYDLSAKVRLGLDLRMVMPMYSTFMIDWDDDTNADPESTPSTFVFMPTLQIVATF